MTMELGPGYSSVITGIVRYGLPKVSLHIQTSRVAGDVIYPNATQGRPINDVSQYGSRLWNNSERVVTGHDYGDQLLLLKMIGQVGQELNDRLQPDRSRDSEIYDCVRVLMSESYPTNKIYNEQHPYRSGPRKLYDLYRLAGTDKNSALLSVLRDVCSRMTSDDFDRIVDKVFGLKDVDLNMLGVIVQMSRWSRIPLNPEHSIKFIGIFNDKREDSPSQVQGLITKAMSGVTPFLSRN